jgi:hypothetical protein
MLTKRAFIDNLFILLFDIQQAQSVFIGNCKKHLINLKLVRDLESVSLAAKNVKSLYVFFLLNSGKVLPIRDCRSR